jgi:hypothetical protein
MDAALRPYLVTLVAVGGVIAVVVFAAQAGWIEIGSLSATPPTPEPEPAAPKPGHSAAPAPGPRRSRSSTKRSSEARVRAMLKRAERTGRQLDVDAVAKRLGVSRRHAQRLLREAGPAPSSASPAPGD